MHLRQCGRTVSDLCSAASSTASTGVGTSPGCGMIGRTNAMRASTMDDALRRGEAYHTAGADVLLLSMAHEPEQLRAIVECG